MDDRVEISRVLLDNGIMPNLKGYRYCFDILLMLREKNIGMKNCYIDLGKKYGILPNSIEKGILNSIEKAFCRQDIQKKYQSLCLESGKISNKKFLLLLSEELKAKIKRV